MATTNGQNRESISAVVDQAILAKGLRHLSEMTEADFGKLLDRLARSDSWELQSAEGISQIAEDTGLDTLLLLDLLPALLSLYAYISEKGTSIGSGLDEVIGIEKEGQIRARVERLLDRVRKPLTELLRELNMGMPLGVARFRGIETQIVFVADFERGRLDSGNRIASLADATLAQYPVAIIAFHLEKSRGAFAFSVGVDDINYIVKKLQALSKKLMDVSK